MYSVPPAIASSPPKPTFYDQEITKEWIPFLYEDSLENEFKQWSRSRSVRMELRSTKTAKHFRKVIKARGSQRYSCVFYPKGTLQREKTLLILQKDKLFNGDRTVKLAYDPIQKKIFAFKAVRAGAQGAKDPYCKREQKFYEKCQKLMCETLPAAHTVLYSPKSDPSSTKFGFAMPWYTDGDLIEVLTKVHNENFNFSQEKRLSIFFDIAKAVETLHKNKMIHRDIKPENIFLKDGRAYLGDGGHAVSNHFKGSIEGTFTFLAPEIYNQAVTGTEEVIFNTKGDLWALGLTAAYLFSDTDSCIKLSNFLENRWISTLTIQNQNGQIIPVSFAECLRKDFNKLKKELVKKCPHNEGKIILDNLLNWIPEERLELSGLLRKIQVDRPAN